MFLDEPPATPETTALYDEDLADGFVMNLTRIWAWRPEVYRAFAELRAATSEGSGLTDRDLAVLVSAAVSSRGDSYCSLAWGSKLAGLADEETAAAVLRGGEAGLSDREQALAAWARRIAADPTTTTQDDVDRLRAVGLDERAIVSATAIVGFRLAFSTVSNALGAVPDAQLLADAPREVAEAVTFGRPPQQP